MFRVNQNQTPSHIMSAIIEGLFPAPKQMRPVVTIPVERSDIPSLQRRRRRARRLAMGDASNMRSTWF